MNLNQILQRINDMSAELLTLHNDLAFVLQGDVQRQALVVEPLWQKLEEGDSVHVQTTFIGHDGTVFDPGVYIVENVEDSEYAGPLPFSLNNEGEVWIFDAEVDGKEALGCLSRDNMGTNARYLWRKV